VKYVTISKYEYILKGYVNYYYQSTHQLLLKHSYLLENKMEIKGLLSLLFSNELSYITTLVGHHSIETRRNFAQNSH
jgi:hypothetical protein